MQREKLVKILFFSNIVLGVSAVIDMFLWLYTGFRVPSFVVSGFSLAFILNSLALIKVLGDAEI